MQYDESADIFTTQLIDKKIDHAYETDTMTVHVKSSCEPVLLEVFNTRAFFATAAKTLPSMQNPSFDDGKRFFASKVAIPDLSWPKNLVPGKSWELRL